MNDESRSQLCVTNSFRPFHRGYVSLNTILRGCSVVVAVVVVVDPVWQGWQ
jgi:hypothetical protein